MDLFSRKKKRQPTDPADRSVPYERTSSGRNPVNVDTVSGGMSRINRDYQPGQLGSNGMYISNPSGNPTLGMGVGTGRDRERYVSRQLRVKSGREDGQVRRRGEMG